MAFSSSSVSPEKFCGGKGGGMLNGGGRGMKKGGGNGKLAAPVLGDVVVVVAELTTMKAERRVSSMAVLQ
jgi:hypothetical protein